jgi:hypothetical protein
MDEANNVTNSRRITDVETEVEFKLLRYELGELAQKQITDELRIKYLEEESDEVQRKISIGKGVLYGVLIASGSLGLVLAGKLRAILEVFK